MPMISAVQVANILKGIPRDLPRGTTGPQWIALARNESGPAGSGNYDINAALFNTTARNPQPCSSRGDHANGLWQFCENTLDKATANEAIAATYKAFELYERRGWQPWAGSHSPSASDREAWGEAGGSTGVNPLDPRQAWDIASGIVTDPLEMVAAALAPLKDFVKMIADVAKWVGDPQNWVRIVQVGGGVTLALLAASLVAKPVIQEAKRTVSPF